MFCSFRQIGTALPPPMPQDPLIVAGYRLPMFNQTNEIFNQIQTQGKMENYHKLRRTATNQFPYLHGDQNFKMFLQNLRMNAHATLLKEPKTNLAKATAIHLGSLGLEAPQLTGL